MSSGAYFQTWSSRWASDPTKLDLANIDYRVKIVYLSFVDPKTTYSLGQKTWATTGLEFSMDFMVVKKAIDILTGRGVQVMLSVGGATKKFPQPYTLGHSISLYALCIDLGCSGLDVDWEDTYKNREDFGNIIKTLAMNRGSRKLSAACWSTGAYPNDGSDYQGMNIIGLQKSGVLLDWINIMSYDAGPTYDMDRAYKAYRDIYAGTIYLGLLVGAPGWGGYLLKTEDIKKAVQLSGNKVFVWAYQKEPTGTPTVGDILAANSTTKVDPTIGMPNPPPPTSVSTLVCPNCATKLIVTKQ